MISVIIDFFWKTIGFRFFDFCIRKYIWFQEFFQEKKNKYAEILESEHWYYTGVLLTNKNQNNYHMIHTYSTTLDSFLSSPKEEEKEEEKVIDRLCIIKNENGCICNRNINRNRSPFTQIQLEKSKVQFLYIEYINSNANVTLSLDIPLEMMCIGNELFTPGFIYRLLDHQYSSSSFVFDLDYTLVLVDPNLHSTSLSSNHYIVLSKDRFEVMVIEL